MNRQRDAHLDVADAVRITAVQDDAVAGNLLVLLQIKDVSHPQLGGRDLNHHVAPEHLHLGAVRLLPVRKAQHANLVRFRSLDIIAGFSGGRHGEDEYQREPRRPRIVHRDGVEQLRHHPQRLTTTCRIAIMRK